MLKPMKSLATFIFGLYLIAAGASFLGMVGDHDIQARRCLAEIASGVDCTDTASSSDEALFHVQAFQRLALGVLGFDDLMEKFGSGLAAALFVLVSVTIIQRPSQLLLVLAQSRWREVVTGVRQVFLAWFVRIKSTDPLPIT